MYIHIHIYIYICPAESDHVRSYDIMLDHATVEHGHFRR